MDHHASSDSDGNRWSLRRRVSLLWTTTSVYLVTWQDFHKHLRQFYMSHTTLPTGDTRLLDSSKCLARYCRPQWAFHRACRLLFRKSFSAGKPARTQRA